MTERSKSVVTGFIKGFAALAWVLGIAMLFVDLALGIVILAVAMLLSVLSNRRATSLRAGQRRDEELLYERFVEEHKTALMAEPWVSVDAAMAQRLETEARAEIAPVHELYGLSLVAIAKCGSCGHTAFEVSDGTFAVIHLSYSQPDRPPWPLTTRCSDTSAMEAVMSEHW